MAVYSCKSLPGESKQTNHFLRRKPKVFFSFFVGSYKVGKLNVSTSSGNQVLYSEPFRSVQEIKVLTSRDFIRSHWVKKPEGGDGAAFWLESENQCGFKACVLEFSDGSSGTYCRA